MLGRWSERGGVREVEAERWSWGWGGGVREVELGLGRCSVRCVAGVVEREFVEWTSRVG